MALRHLPVSPLEKNRPSCLGSLKRPWKWSPYEEGGRPVRWDAWPDCPHMASEKVPRRTTWMKINADPGVEGSSRDSPSYGFVDWHWTERWESEVLVTWAPSNAPDRLLWMSAREENVGHTMCFYVVVVVFWFLYQLVFFTWHFYIYGRNFHKDMF